MYKKIKNAVRPYVLPIVLPALNHAAAAITSVSKRWLRARGHEVVGNRRGYFYDEDNLATSKNHDFVFASRFVAANDTYLSGPFTGRSEGHHHGRWNLHISLWAATHAINLKADIVQLGVFEGSEAAAMADYTNFGNSGCQMYLVDTFTGIPEGQWTPDEIAAGADSAQWSYKEMGDLYQFTKRRMSKYPNVHVIQGIVPDILPSVSVKKIGLLMLDMNVALPERAAAEYFWDRVVSGGIIISDDYGHSRPGAGFYGQKLAFDEFARLKNVEVLTIPTGHGLIIKP
jgi:hypothetical protein